MVTRNSLLVFAILAPLTLAGTRYVSVAGGAKAQGGQIAQPRVIPQPQGWTPFDADYVDAEPGRLTSTGHFYRGGDGSTRQEETWDQGRRRFLRIVNIPNKQAFTYLPRTETWRVQPVEYPPSGYVPPGGIFRTDMPGLTHLPKPYENLDVYEYRTHNGTIMVQAPVLNFLALRTLDPATGRSFSYLNIKVGPQNAELFQQPAGVTAFEKSIHPLVVLQIVGKP